MKSFFLGVALVAISLGAQEVGGVGSGGGASAVPIPSETPVTGDLLHPSIAVLPLRGQAASTYGDPSDDIYQRVTGAFFKQGGKIRKIIKPGGHGNFADIHAALAKQLFCAFDLLFIDIVF